MQLICDQFCNKQDEIKVRRWTSFRASLLLFLNIVTDILVIVNDWNANLYIALLLFFIAHGCIQLSVSIYFRYNNCLLSILGFFGIGQVASLLKIWKNIDDNQLYRQWMELCWIQTTMITIPTLSLQIWSMIAFVDVSQESYSPIKITSVIVGLWSIGPTIVSLFKFMNEHAQPTLQTLQKSMKQQQQLTNKLMKQVNQTDYTQYIDHDTDTDTSDNHKRKQSKSISDVKHLLNPIMDISHDVSDPDPDLEPDDDDEFDLDHDPEPEPEIDDGYARNQLNSRQSQSITTMNETESISAANEYWKMQAPELQIVSYSDLYYYAFVSLLPTDFLIRVVSIGFLERIVFGSNINSMYCVLYYSIIIYFIIWRFTYSENYGDLCFVYKKYDKFKVYLLNNVPCVLIVIQSVYCIFYNIMPSGYMFYENFHRELYPKFVICINNAIQLVLFIVFLYVFNRHLDGHHHEKIIQYDMEDSFEDIVLIAWQIILSLSWLIYFISLYIYNSQGTKQLEEQLESLIPTYKDDIID